MHEISIRYEFSGNETEWEAAISAFIAAVNNDAEIAGKFHYRVNKAKEGNQRIHWGWWDTPETVQTLQSRDYFKAFAATLKGFAGSTLSPVPLTEFMSTAR